MAQTWDTARTGGGTYEFVQDTQGHYKLQSVGFEKLNKLNLPELKKEKVAATTATPKKDTAALSTQTKQAFGDVQPFYYDQKGEGGTGTQYAMRKEGDLSTETKPMTTGDSTLPPQLGGPSTLEQAKQFAGTPVKEDTRPDWAKGVDARGYENIGKEVRSLDQVGRQNVDQVLAARKDPNRFAGIVGPQKPSPYQDAIMRGETGVKYSKPEKPEIQKTVTTQLKKVTTALSPLAKAVGFVMNPARAIGGIIAGALPKDTPTQKHARKYFNADDQTGRISGNPATDLYAGFNRTSAFGNLEKAGQSRIDTRTKTAEKMAGKWSKERLDKFKATTEKMKGQQKDYKNDKDNDSSINPSKAATVSRTNKDYGQFGRRQQHTAAGGGNGGPSGRVICTELHRTHELSTKDWVRDIHFTFNTLTENHIKGYLIWAIPTVEHMKKYPKYRKFWKHVAQHRANDIAWRLNEGKFDLLGRIYAGIGEPLCWLIGNFTGNKQINELNIKNWRKA